MNKLENNKLMYKASINLKRNDMAKCKHLNLQFLSYNINVRGKQIQRNRTTVILENSQLIKEYHIYLIIRQVGFYCCYYY